MTQKLTKEEMDGAVSVAKKWRDESGIPDKCLMADALLQSLDENAALAKEVEDWRTFSKPHINSGGPCPCCKQLEGSKCGCLAREAHWQEENAALAKRLEAAEEAWREYRAMECAFDTLVPNREGWVEKLSEYADGLEAIRQKVESAFAVGASK